MAQIINLQSTSTLGTDDQAIIRQGTIDKRISLELAGTLSWAKRNGFSYLGEHSTGLTFPDTESFSLSQGVPYFVKVGVGLPYDAVGSDPSIDTNLISGEDYADYVLSKGEKQQISVSVYPTGFGESASTSTPYNNAPAGTEALRDAVGDKIYYTSEIVSGMITALDFSGGTATVGGVAVTLDARTEIDSGNIGETIGVYSNYTASSVADMIAGKTVGDGIVSHDENQEWSVAGRVLKNDGGEGSWHSVLTTSVTVNGFNIVQSTVNPLISLVLRSNKDTDARAFGGNPDGSTGNLDVIGVIDSLGGCKFREGVYAVEDDASLDGAYKFEGGILKPASTKTLTFSKQINAGQIRVFDVSGGGLIKINPDHMFVSVEAAWFGMTPIAITESIAKANMKSIALAVNMAGFGIGGGGGIEPVVMLPVGIHSIDDWEGSGVGANVKSYQKVIGRGDTSYLSVRPGAASMDVFLVNESAANSVIFDKFQIDGNYASQGANVHHAITINPASGPVIYSKIGTGIYIKEMSGWGIRIIGEGMDNSEIEPFLVRDCVLGNLLTSKADLLTVKGKYRSSKGTSPSIHITGTGVKAVDLIDVQSEENGGEGLLVSTIDTESGSVKVHNGSFSRNGKDGVLFSTTSYQSSVNGAKIERNGGNGVQLFNTENAKVKNCDITANKQRGVLGVNADNCSITGNEFDKNSDTNVNVYDDITLIGSSNNNVQINKHRNSLSTTRYNIAVDDAACVDNLVTNNDMKGSGNTGTITNAGTGTSQTPGNRV